MRNTRRGRTKNELAKSALSRLIEPASLNPKDRTRAFQGIERGWLKGEVIIQDSPLSECRIEIETSQDEPFKCSINAYSLAIIFELTRFSNNIIGNENRGPAYLGKTKAFLKLSLYGTKSAKRDVGRIVLDARKAEIVRQGGSDGDVTPNELLAPNSGPSKWDARPLAKACVKRQAEQAVKAGLVTTEYAAQYLRNLEALFQAHDAFVAELQTSEDG